MIILENNRHFSYDINEYSGIISFDNKNQKKNRTYPQVTLVKFNFTKIFLISPRYFRFHQDIFDFTKIFLISPRYFWFHQDTFDFTKSPTISPSAIFTKCFTKRGVPIKNYRLKWNMFYEFQWNISFKVSILHWSIFFGP